MVSVEPEEESRTAVATTEESGAHHAHRFGFWVGSEEARESGVPAERRPLTRRAVRHWTVGTLVASALLAAVVAVAHSRDTTHGGETARVQSLVDVAAAPAAATRAVTTPPTVVPLEALPLDKDAPEETPAVPKKATHKAVVPANVSLVENPSKTTTAKSWSARTLPPSRAKTTATTAKTPTAKTATPTATAKAAPAKTAIAKTATATAKTATVKTTATATPKTATPKTAPPTVRATTATVKKTTTP